MLHFRAIQGHSGGNLVDPELQDNILLPEDFTECICYIGNIGEMHSIIRSGLIPGGGSLKSDRQSVFFTGVNLVDDDQSMEEIPCDLDKPRIAPCKKYVETSSKHSVLVQLKTRSEEGLQFYQTRSHAIVLYNTLSAICIEKAVCMKMKEELYHMVYLSPRLQRVVLKASSQSGQQD